MMRASIGVVLLLLFTYFSGNLPILANTLNLSPSELQQLFLPLIQSPPPILPAVAVETVPVPNNGDAADDPAIWIHPTNRALSTVIGTDKDGGLAVYDLEGNQLQYLPDGEMNNVDLRNGFSLGAQTVTIVAAGNRSDDTLAIYRVNVATRLLENVNARPIQSALGETYGLCMYQSPTSRKFYVIVNDKDGKVEQWEVFDNGAGLVDANLVRTFEVGSTTEGCVADDQWAALYIGEESEGIWKYGAEPESGEQRVLVDRTGDDGHLTADVEGLTLYYANNGSGYLIASSQGSDTFVVYQRTGNNEYITTFSLPERDGVDAVTGTDGIDVTSAALGPAFPQGLFVAQDDENDGGNQNFKLIPWQTIAGEASPGLVVSPQ